MNESDQKMRAMLAIATADNPDPKVDYRPAGKYDPDGAAAADANRTRQCGHPPARDLSHLSCRNCGVFIIAGKVIDRGIVRG